MTQLKRPSGVTLILLTCWIPTLGFMVALFVLGSIPDNVAPYLTVAFVLVPMIVFLPLFAFTGYKYSMRRARERFVKLKNASCIICGEVLPDAVRLRDLRGIQRPHYETVHPEVWRWGERWKKINILGGTAGIFIVGLATYQLATENALQSILFYTYVPAYILAVYLSQKREIERFRSRWKRQLSENPR